MKAKKLSFMKGVVVGLLLGILAETGGLYVSDLAARVTRIEAFLTQVTQGR